MGAKVLLKEHSFCLHAHKSRLCGDLAAVRFRKSAVIRTCPCSLRSILKENKTSGLDLGNTLQLVFAVLLLILGVLVAIQGVKKLLEKDDKAIA